MATKAELLICVTCRGGKIAPEGEIREGQRLFDAMPEIDGVTITPTECLQNCESGCSVALRGPERWTYVFGALDADADAAMLAEGAAKYHAAPAGLIPWRERPEHFKRNCVARIPPYEES